MSAVDFAARGMAARAGALNPMTFEVLGQSQVPAHVSRMASTGHGAAGRGTAHYVCDDLATPALRAAFPGAVFAAADGRHFRLLGDEAGFVTPEQLGCPAYAAGTNQRAFIQAAIDYVLAVGLKGVKFPQRKYELWAPARTGEYSLQTDYSGNFLVINGPVQLLGMHGARTMLHCKGPTGGSLATDYQVVTSVAYGANTIWRGHGLMVTGTIGSGAARPEEGTLSSLLIRDIILFSDAVGVRNNAWPAKTTPVDRINCWDTSNKGVYVQANVHTGAIYLENFDVIGFLGEAFYTSGNAQSDVVVRNMVVKHSNGQAINPSGPARFDVDGLYAENCSSAFEGWGGKVTGRVVNAHFKDVTAAGFNAWTNASGQSVRDDNSPALLYVDATIEGFGGDCYVGSYVHGRLRLIDMRLALIAGNYLGTGARTPITGVDLDVTTIVNKLSLSTAVRIGSYSAPITAVVGDGASVTFTSANHGFAAGQKITVAGFTPAGYNGSNVTVTAATANTFTVANVTTAAATVLGAAYPEANVPNNSIRLNLKRTQYARDNGFACTGIVTQGGDMGPGNYVHARGMVWYAGANTTLVNKAVAIIDEGLQFENGAYNATAFDPSVTASPDWSPGFIRAAVFSAGAGVYTVNLPSVGTYPNGAEVVLAHQGTTTGFIEVFDGATKRALMGVGTIAKFRANISAGKWDMVTPPQVRTATASIAFTSTALGADSGPYTIALPGCRPWHKADVLPASVTTGFAISSVRPEADQVRFWARNVDGANPATLAAQTYTARCWIG